MPASRSFFDTNILVYTDDRAAPAKQKVALQLVEEARRQGGGVVSTQVLQEYFVAATRKLGVEHHVARRKTELFARFDVVLVDLEHILAAVDLHRARKLSYWDALIVQAAMDAGCGVLYSEDLQSDGRFGDVRIVNPFR